MSETPSEEPVLESAMGGAGAGAGPAGFSEADPLDPAEAREALEALGGTPSGGTVDGDEDVSETEATPT